MGSAARTTCTKHLASPDLTGSNELRIGTALIRRRPAEGRQASYRLVVPEVEELLRVSDRLLAANGAVIEKQRPSDDARAE